MSDRETALNAILFDRVDDILDRCSSCGRCVEVCPMPGPAGIDITEPSAVVNGVLEILRGGTGTPEARRWASVCTGSGNCLDACGDGVNPRFMLTLARIAMKRDDPEEAKTAGKRNFQKMSRGVRVLSRLQLSADQLRRLGQLPDDKAAPAAPEIVFYTGCNILKTPHIALHCLDVLDALGVRYQVHGGPANCCGIMQLRGGDSANGVRQGSKSIERFAKTGAPEVVAWCPTCQIQMGETMQPDIANEAADPFALSMMASYLARRVEDLKPLFTHRVEKRVGLHEHPGVRGVSEAVETLLCAIPGIEFVDLEQPRVGYMCNTLAVLPEFKANTHEAILRSAEAKGVDALVGVYHACHRDLCSHQRDWPFEVVNFMELIGEAMGFHHHDRFKELKMMQDVEAVMADCADMIATHGLDPEEVRDLVAKEMLGEQPLPLRGNH